MFASSVNPCQSNGQERLLHSSSTNTWTNMAVNAFCERGSDALRRAPILWTIGHGGCDRGASKEGCGEANCPSGVDHPSLGPGMARGAANSGLWYSPSEELAALRQAFNVPRSLKEGVDAVRFVRHVGVRNLEIPSVCRAHDSAIPPLQPTSIW